ncbi:protein PELOTA 1 isoform X2 [Canna indica]|uniref:Protein PELOTA 1 isoform X2 n=1 Tax=Canna indica TaxID=4628 RepID=A0AAQ3L679_9LILI|nr:protein PELOTA 1 isoform X2 [Canna indica]
MTPTTASSSPLLFLSDFSQSICPSYTTDPVCLSKPTTKQLPSCLFILASPRTMKLVRRDLVRGGPGSVKIILEDDDDMWHVYNLISVGDSIQVVTVRKVIRDLAHGGRDTERVKLKLEIKVEQWRLSQGETTMKKFYDKEKVVEVMHGLGAGWSMFNWNLMLVENF